LLKEKVKMRNSIILNFDFYSIIGLRRSLIILLSFPLAGNPSSQKDSGRTGMTDSIPRYLQQGAHFDWGKDGFDRS
jgi:hypothetical protein